MTKRIQAMFGPMTGYVMDIDDADADQGVADGWARNVDPHDPYDPEAPLPEFDPVAHDTMIAAAEAAAKKIRGEEETPPVQARKIKRKEADDSKAKRAEDKVSAEPKRAALQADDKTSQGYETRTARKPKED